MRVLIVKLSSLGDIAHTLIALGDVARRRPDVVFDWVVEEDFADAPTWHRGIGTVIPVALRRWRHRIGQSRREFATFRERLRAQRYDLIVDAQGLLKSAVVGTLARGPIVGFDYASARETMSAFAYRRRVAVAWNQHAVERLRHLLAGALELPLPSAPARAELVLPAVPAGGEFVLLLHGASWTNKRPPSALWAAIAERARTDGLRVVLAQGNAADTRQAREIQRLAPHCEILPLGSLNSIVGYLAHAQVVVGTDSGLAHCASAFARPTVTLYGPTSAAATGAYGAAMNLQSTYRCSPCKSRVCRDRALVPVVALDGRWVPVEPACFAGFSPTEVWRAATSIARERARGKALA